MPENNDPENSPEYDLKKSTTKIGQLYPVLKAADGEILDGIHRMESDPSWKTLVLPNIVSPEEKLIARMIANFHRRTVATEEKAQWINQLAEIYRNNGLKTEGTRNHAEGPNEIVRKITEVTGIAYRTIMHYLDPSFKQQNRRNLDPEQHPVRSSPEEIIYNHLKYDPRWARGVIDRFKEEHEKELLESPLFRKKILDSIPQKLKQSLSPGLVFDPTKDEQIQELMSLKEEDVFKGNQFAKSMTSSVEHRESARNRRARESKEGYEPLGPLYPIFHEECPNCICSSCDHANVCIERVRPED